MEKLDLNKTIEQELKRLDLKVNELVKTCEDLKKENRLLKQQQSSFSVERSNLIEKHEQARKRVEAMIGRLKSMELSV